jgi:hypothetical protein
VLERCLALCENERKSLMGFLLFFSGGCLFISVAGIESVVVVLGDFKIFNRFGDEGVARLVLLFGG